MCVVKEGSESASEVAQSCSTLCHPMDCSPPGSSVHGIFQARGLEWVAISFSRGSSQPRDRTCVSRTAGRRFTVWATREVKRSQRSSCDPKEDLHQLRVGKSSRISERRMRRTSQKVRGKEWGLRCEWDRYRFMGYCIWQRGGKQRYWQEEITNSSCDKWFTREWSWKDRSAERR